MRALTAAMALRIGPAPPVVADFWVAKQGRRPQAVCAKSTSFPGCLFPKEQHVSLPADRSRVLHGQNMHCNQMCAAAINPVSVLVRLTCYACTAVSLPAVPRTLFWEAAL